MSDPSDSPESGSKERKKVIFFVDDEEDVRGVWSELLRKHDYRVLEAGTAEEALWFLESFTAHIDILLMDVNLPDGWGASVAQSLRQLHPEMAVVYTTGYAATDPILSGALSDAPFVIPKPSTTQEVLRILEEALAAGPPE